MQSFHRSHAVDILLFFQVSSPFLSSVSVLLGFEINWVYANGGGHLGSPSPRIRPSPSDVKSEQKIKSKRVIKIQQSGLLIL